MDDLPVGKEALVKRRLPERDLDIEGVGTIRIRSLSRHEAMAIRNGPEDDYEVSTLHHGVVDPTLSIEDVHTWMSAAPAGELEPVITAILDLSGMLPDSLKEAVHSFHGGLGEEADVPSGEGAGDDGGPPF